MKLHLAVNSGFIQMFAEIAKKIDATTNHQFVIYGEQMTGQVIDKTKLTNNFTIVEKLNNDNNFINDLVIKSSTIYIHFLSNEVIEYLNKFDISNKKIVWFFWGADAFSLPEVYTKLQQYRLDIVNHYLGKFKQFFFKKKTSKIKLNFLKKIDYIAHYSVDDFTLVKPLLKATVQFKYFTYGIFENVVNQNIELKGKDILLGNSASKNNHHIYTIKNILPQTITQKIYCPLPYGANKSYTIQVIHAGNLKFGNNFIGLTELIETNDYCENILAKTEFALMPHNRSQAWGNIMQLLWQGSKVYMFESNNLYKFLKQKGFQIFKLTEKSYKTFSTVKIDVEMNKKLLQQHFGLSNLKSSYKEILSL
ncbi:MAG: TDP-N-acetylfucosamine:lipid II N-acetylfucosaminyltransferase [Bacteroidetes bacterium]|nr:TDP-N-acetylfucosamine:lipid II N-acetylfucosaminyltransferase [Bacteroidota bacterium]